MKPKCTNPSLIAIHLQWLIHCSFFIFFPSQFLAQSTLPQPEKLLIKTQNGLQVWNETNSRGDIYSLASELRALHPDWQIEPDYFYKLIQTPDDPRFVEQTNLSSVGASCLAGVGAETAWEETQGNAQAVIVIIDGGMDLNHEDLKANLWTNPDEIANNGIDDDGNGYIDDIHGWDFSNDDNDPQDVNGHGTHVAGIIGARGNNGLGISGICWNTKLMPLKFTNDQGYGSTSDAIRAIDYAIDMKLRGENILVINNSWGGGDNSQFLKEAIERANKAGILFVAAAGNDGLDIDRYPFYPASFDLENVISVGAIDCQASLASFSNYGINSVDITAPGDAILSTLPGDNYGPLTGTSMAAPHVTGSIGLIQALGTDYSHLEIKEAVINSAYPIADLNGKILSGANLNLANVLSFTPDLWGSQYVFGSSITDIIARDTIVWVGTNGGLLRVNTNTNESIHYTNANSGLPHNLVTCLLLDPNGNLWVGTREGLASFDSNGWLQFASSNPRLPSPNISALTMQGDSVLWVGTKKGWVNRYNIHTQRWGAPKEITEHGIKSLTVAPNPRTGKDALYLATGKGLFRKNLLCKGNEILTFAPILQMRKDHERIWVVMEHEDQFQIRSFNYRTGILSEHPRLNEILNDSLPTQILEVEVSERGTLWAGDKYGNLLRYQLEDESLEIFRRRIKRIANGVSSLFIQEEDRVWIGNFRGDLALFNGESWEEIDIPIDNLPRGRIRALATNADSVLMGTGNGLLKYKEGIFNVLDLEAGRNLVNTLDVDKEGDIWIGTQNGLTTNFGGDWQTFTTDSSGLPDDNVKAIVAGGNNIWIGTSGGLARFNKNTRRWRSPVDCCPNDSILALAPGRSGVLWIGTANGLSRLRDNTFEHSFTDSLLGRHKVLSLDNDTIKQRLWVGTNRGLVRLKQLSRNRVLGEIFNLGNSGIPSNQIQSVVVDRLHRVWVGTPNGIGMFDGKHWEVYNATNSFLPDNQILSLAATPEEGIWAGTIRGLGIIIPEDLVAFSMDEQVVCLGESLLFENQGIDGDSLMWLINDSVVSQVDSFSYMFDEPGNYKVSLVISIDTVSFTDSGFVTVRPPLEISLPADTMSLASSISLDGGDQEQTTWLWTNKLGDTLGQSSQLSVYESGIYILDAQDECGNHFRDSTDVLLLGDGAYVLPGDALPDGKINLSDWLMVSLLDGASGTARPDSLNLWEPQSASDWPTEDFQSDLTSTVKDSTVDYKHADVDGDGFIDIETDGNEINQYVENSIPSVHISSPIDSTGLSLTMEILNKQVYADTIKHSLVFDFYLEGDSNLLTQVHGVAFRLNLGTSTDSAWAIVYDSTHHKNLLLADQATYVDLGFTGKGEIEPISENGASFAKGKVRIGGGGVIVVIENIDTSRISLQNYQVDLNMSLNSILMIDSIGDYVAVNELAEQQIITVPLNLETTAPFVDITTFEAGCDSGHIQLNWTSWEQDVSYYVIEEFIPENLQYKFIDTILPNTSSVQNPQYYNFSPPSDSTKWYRLKIVDSDNNAAYTENILARSCSFETLAKQNSLTNGTQEILNVYPNPTAGNVWIKLATSIEDGIEISVFNLNGQRAFQQKNCEADMNDCLRFDFSSLVPGVYFLHLRTRHESILQQKIIVLK